jgi:ribosome-binding factor A
MKHRLERVKALIKRELGEIIPREMSFRATLVTVQHVDITPDLKNCYVHVSVIGKPVDQEAAVAALEEHRGILQHALAKRVILKYTPQLHFRRDTSIERGDRIMQIMQDLLPPDDAQ